MGQQLQKYRTRKPLAKAARGIAVDALQVVNYIEDGRKKYAISNTKSMIKKMERLLKELRKEL